MEKIEYLKSFYQISEILNSISPKMKSKIPQNIIDYFEHYKIKEYNCKIDTNVLLEEQNLLPITKGILTVLYRDYLCNEKEKAMLNRKLIQNEIKYQDELRKKYNPNELFKEKEKKNIIKSEKNRNKNSIDNKHNNILFTRIIKKFCK